MNQAQLNAMVPKNILSGFRFTGSWPCDRNIFTELDFAPSNVTDRAVVQDDSESQLTEATTPCFPNRQVVGDAMDIQSGAPFGDIGTHNLVKESPSLIAGRMAVTPRQNLSLSDQLFISNISPSDILNIPKTAPRKRNRMRDDEAKLEFLLSS